MDHKSNAVCLCVQYNRMMGECRRRDESKNEQLVQFPSVTRSSRATAEGGTAVGSRRWPQLCSLGGVCVYRQLLQAALPLPSPSKPCRPFSTACFIQFTDVIVEWRRSLSASWGLLYRSVRHTCFLRTPCLSITDLTAYISNCICYAFNPSSTCHLCHHLDPWASFPSFSLKNASSGEQRVNDDNKIHP